MNITWIFVPLFFLAVVLESNAGNGVRLLPQKKDQTLEERASQLNREVCNGDDPDRATCHVRVDADGTVYLILDVIVEPVTGDLGLDDSAPGEAP